jgi:hypothetical protein
MAMGGAITAVAVITTVGIGATTMAGGIITIGGDFYLKATKGLQWLAASFSLDVSIKDLRYSVTIADKPTQGWAIIFCRECPESIYSGRIRSAAYPLLILVSYWPPKPPCSTS